MTKEKKDHDSKRKKGEGEEECLSLVGAKRVEKTTGEGETHSSLSWKYHYRLVRTRMIHRVLRQKY